MEKIIDEIIINHKLEICNIIDKMQYYGFGLAFFKDYGKLMVKEEDNIPFDYLKCVNFKIGSFDKLTYYSNDKTIDIDVGYAVYSFSNNDKCIVIVIPINYQRIEKTEDENKKIMIQFLYDCEKIFKQEFKKRVFKEELAN